MTRQREPVAPEPGDWAVALTAASSGKRTLLTRPYHAVLLGERFGEGWNAVSGVKRYHMFVADADLIRVCLSCGEALQFADRLNQVQRDYEMERTALRPKFEQRILALLNA